MIFLIIDELNKFLQKLCPGGNLWIYLHVFYEVTVTWLWWTFYHIWIKYIYINVSDDDDVIVVVVVIGGDGGGGSDEMDVRKNKLEKISILPNAWKLHLFENERIINNFHDIY